MADRWNVDQGYAAAAQVTLRDSNGDPILAVYDGTRRWRWCWAWATTWPRRRCR
jgi:hypothetical protein